MPSGQRIGGQAEAELAVVFVRGVAHHLMNSCGIEVAQQPTDDVRMMQTGIAGEMKRRRHGFDGNVGRVEGSGAHIGDRRAVRNLAGARDLVQLLVALVQQRSGRPQFQVRLADEAMHHLPFVELG